jgi:predicted ferric reductase
VVPASLVARTVLWGALLVNLIVIEILFFTADTPVKNNLIETGKFFGLHVALVMIFQLVLIARLPWLDRRVGMDQLTSWHRWIGFTLFWLLVLHVGFIITGYAKLDGNNVVVQIGSLAGSFPVLLGMAAFVLIVTIAAVSMRAARRRLSYETWHALHIAVYVVITLALIHQLYELTTFDAMPIATAYWWLLWTFAIGALITGRVIVPLLRNARHQFRVAAVVPESDNVVSVHVTGRDLERLPARAGQFFLWRFPGHNPWWQVNPFSMSAAPNGRSLRLTAKAVGRTSAGLRDLTVGTRVFAEGPYGAFTALQRTRENTLLIAGGVGITPIRSLLEDLPGHTILLYRVHTMADAVLLAELQQLAAMRGAQVHVLTGRTGEGNTPFAPATMLARVPDIRDRDVYVCGPEPMTKAVLKSLRALGVSRAQVHAERFRLAG